MEQLFEEYEELVKRNQDELEHDKSITHLLYIEGFKHSEMDKIMKINKIVVGKIEKRITLVQDFGTLRKQVNPKSNDSSKQLMKDIDMHINSIMFEIDKLETLKQKTQRFLKSQSQTTIKPSTAPIQLQSTSGDQMYQKTTNTKEYRSSFQFYRAQRDNQIQSHNQKWIKKQYDISQKQIDDELQFQRFRSEIEEKQEKAEDNLELYRNWQQRQLQEQAELNGKRLQLHKDRMLKDNEDRLFKLRQKMQKKEESLLHQKRLLNEYFDLKKNEKQTHFERIKQQSMQADFSKSQQNMQQRMYVEEKEKYNERKTRYIQESKEWTQNQLRIQSMKKDEKIQKAAMFAQIQDENRRKKFEDSETKQLQYQQKYQQLYNEYQQQTTKAKEQKIHKTLVNKAFRDASEQQFTKFQFDLRAQSEAQGQRLKERRIKIAQEELAGEHLLRQQEINQRQYLLSQEFEMKRQRVEQKEEEEKLKRQLIMEDEKQLLREREKEARKLEMEKESKGKQKLMLTRSEMNLPLME